MSHFSAKTALFVTLIAFGSLMSTSSHAAIVRSSNGMPVTTKDGSCVISNWEGENDCEAAKKMAGMEQSPCPTPMKDEWDHHEKVVYFDFNKSDLTPRAKHHLDHLAEKIHAMSKHKNHGPKLTIVGYADRIGNAEYNQKLALKRADSVRGYLLSKGVDAKKIEVRSLGKTSPKADCPADLPRDKMIKCLQEDRRVEIEFAHDVKHDVK
jgi:outer membrane protein OmpA-like peptidoglycan-associated protein